MLKQLRQVVLEVDLKASRQMTAGKAIKASHCNDEINVNQFTIRF